LRGAQFVHDVKFSDRIREAAVALGAQPLAERSGHAFLFTRMRQTGARFGAALTGHYFFRELEGGDDGLFTACRIIAHLNHSGQTLAELRRSCPTLYVTPDLRIAMDDETQHRAIQQVSKAWSMHPQTTIDGVRVDVPGGWALVRPSVTESALTFRFEAGDFHGLEDLVGRFCNLLPNGVGPQLWSRYKMAMGTHETEA
jgi:phosphomannomutase